MSSVPGVANSDVWVVLGALATGTLALEAAVLRDAARPGEIVAECADGCVIGVWRGQVRRRPGPTEAQSARRAARYRGLEKRDRRERTHADLAPGALESVRIRPGREGEAAWVVEGWTEPRDAAAFEWEFEAEPDARRVLQGLTDRIVRAPGATAR